MPFRCIGPNWLRKYKSSFMCSEQPADPVSCSNLSLQPVRGFGFVAVKLCKNSWEMSVGAAPESPMTIAAGSLRLFT